MALSEHGNGMAWRAVYESVFSETKKGTDIGK
jgi:hypothetical protein